jgi:hypothetical protein
VTNRRAGWLGMKGVAERAALAAAGHYRVRRSSHGTLPSAGSIDPPRHMPSHRTRSQQASSGFLTYSNIIFSRRRKPRQLRRFEVSRAMTMLMEGRAPRPARLQTGRRLASSRRMGACARNIH